MPGTFHNGSQVRDSSGGGLCRSRVVKQGIVSYDEFESEFFMKNALTMVRASYVAMAFDGSTYDVFYTPLSLLDESALEPLTHFGFQIQPGAPHSNLCGPSHC